MLVKLPAIPESELSELLIEAWLCRAPKRLAKEWLARQSNADMSGPQGTSGTKSAD